MNSITYVGNLTHDPELRFSAEGKPRSTFSVAVNEGSGDKEKTHFINATAFGTLGENVAESLRRGMRVVVVGRLDTYKREVTIGGADKSLTMVSFIASEVSPSLLWARATVTKVTREDAGNGGGASAPASSPTVAPASGSASTSTEGNGSTPVAAKAAAVAVSEEDPF